MTANVEKQSGILVLGMHRSGTSALTSVLARLGLRIGPCDDLLPPTLDNPDGYWESRRLTHFNERILTELGGGWSCPPNLSSGWETEPSVTAMHAEARLIFRSVYSASPWVWKDPRNCLLAPFWLQLLDRCSVALIFRHPLEVCRSLTKRDGLTEEHGLALWERYCRRAIEAAAGRMCLVVRNGELIEKSRRLVDPLMELLCSLGLPEPSDPLSAIQAAVKPGLRHHVVTPEGVRAEVLSSEQWSLWEQLLQLQGCHQRFPDVELPPETPRTTAMLTSMQRLIASTRAEAAAEAHRVSAETEDEIRRLGASLVRSVAEVATLLPPLGPTVVAQPAITYHYRLDAAQDRGAYRVWLEARAKLEEEERSRRRERLAALRDYPTVSVLVPVFRPDEDILRRCVDSVVNQDFPDWQLCLCDDGSGDEVVADLLTEFEEMDRRIRVKRREQNGGISAATNAAASVATSDFLAFLDQDDELATGALTAVALALAEDSAIDVLYTDEDKLEPDGGRSDPFFKPDWSPDQLLSHMYVGHLLVVRRSIFQTLGGLRSDYDGSQDYDLVLRCTELARTVRHLPLVAYHWRKITGSTAQDYRAKPQADLAARGALKDAIARRGEQATVEHGLHEGTFRVRRSISDSPLVSVIIPFHNGADLLYRCVTALQERAGHDNWEAVLVDNRSWEPETQAVVARLQRDPRCRFLPYPHDFNWAAINNLAVQHSTGEHLLFLNVDVQGSSDGWLAAMLEHSQRPEVGAVGARLLYPDGRIQHAGVVMGLGGGIAWHAFCYCPPEHPGYFGQAKVTRNYSAVTGACMMVRRSIFDELSGFDRALPVAYNDIDLCLRLWERGYRVVYTPFAELIHEESVVRGYGSREPIETRIMWERWEPIIRRDPFFNPNFDPRRSEFTVPSGLEEVDPWENLLSSVEQWLKRSGAT